MPIRNRSILLSPVLPAFVAGAALVKHPIISCIIALSVFAYVFFLEKSIKIIVKKKRRNAPKTITPILD